jgi:nucleoside-diphosphate-sugar epimerase
MNPLYIDDLSEYVCRLLAQTQSMVVNLAGPQIVSLRGLAERIGRELGVCPAFRVGSEPPGSSYIADATLACTLTGYRPKVGVTEGVRRVIKACESARA